MPDLKISELTAVTTPVGTDEFAVSQGGSTKKETITQAAAAIFLFDDIVWKNATDSLTGFQILDSDGGTPVLNVDTINERLGIRTATPAQALDIASGGIRVASGGVFGAATGLSFGDGDTEIRESADDVLQFITAAAERMRITSAGDIYSTAWTDFGASSVVVGFAATPTVNIWYKKIGNLVWVVYYLNGTSNATTLTFTLPFTAVNSTNARVYTSSKGIDNGSGLTSPAMAELKNNEDKVSVFKDWNALAWTGSGTKEVRGELFYEVAP